MKALDLTALTRALAKNKYVLLVLCIGLLLLLLPRRSATEPTAQTAATRQSAAGDKLESSGIPLGEECDRIAALLRSIRNVGASAVLLSKNGCVVVCEGADSPAVVWEVTNAVAAYTGRGSDRVYVYPMRREGPP